MNNSLKIVRIDTNYCNFLRKFEPKVPYNFNKKDIRPFVGVLFIVNNYMYFAPLSSPKEKHLKIKGNVDLLKLDEGKLGVINFNNMIPVTKNNIINIDLNKRGTSEEEVKYNKLLREQLLWLNRNDEKLYGRSRKLYDKYISGKLHKSVMTRCCNFPLLEEKCLEYNKEIITV